MKSIGEAFGCLGSRPAHVSSGKSLLRKSFINTGRIEMIFQISPCVHYTEQVHKPREVNSLPLLGATSQKRQNNIQEPKSIIRRHGVLFHLISQRVARLFLRTVWLSWLAHHEVNRRGVWVPRFAPGSCQ